MLSTVEEVKIAMTTQMPILTTDLLLTPQDAEDANVNCPTISDDEEEVLYGILFWLEGVVQTVFAIFGIICNTAFSCILSRKELRNSFNILLIILAMYDSTYLLSAILESFRKCFNMATQLHIRLFPSVLYPLKGIALTGSIFMTVAIAFERYVAVHNPINYNRAMNDCKATRSRVIKFFFPVMLASVLFSLPTFFESTLGETKIPETNETHLYIKITSIRIDPTYSFYVNWSKLLVQGMIPVVLLIFFNKKIYCDIKERQLRWRPENPILTSMTDRETTTTTISNRRGLRKASRNVSIPTDHHGESSSLSHSSSEALTLTERNTKRRKMEDRLALLFMGIVSVFLICSLPRLLLSGYETTEIDRAVACMRKKKNVFPIWVWIMTSVSHVLLAINSSVNLLIYCLWNAQFRKVAKMMLLNLCWIGKSWKRQSIIRRRKECKELQKRVQCTSRASDQKKYSFYTTRSISPGPTTTGTALASPNQDINALMTPIAENLSSSVIVIERQSPTSPTGNAQDQESKSEIFTNLTRESARSMLCITMACVEMSQPLSTDVRKCSSLRSSNSLKVPKQRIRFMETAI